MSGISRREFFKKLAPNIDTESPPKEIIIRPPYCEDDAKFTELCPQCTDRPCQSACEESIILFHSDDTPRLDLSSRGCTFCGECLKHCAKGVLNDPGVIRLSVSAVIHRDRCLAWDQVICNSCVDVCEPGAIQFKGLWRPETDTQMCTGCGLCVAHCPVRSIEFVPRSGQ